MITESACPRTVSIFDPSSDFRSSLAYNHLIDTILKRMGADGERGMEMKSLLPLVKLSEGGGPSCKNISLFLLCSYRPHAGKFFYDLIHRWLLPEKRLNIHLFFSTDFKFADEEQEFYTIAEIAVCLDQEQDVEVIKRNLSLIIPEIHFGVSSFYHANRILEIKGLRADEKTSLIQEIISYLVQKRPQDFDYDIFDQMQHFLVMCRHEFKGAREHRHMSRIIYVFYLFQKRLKEWVENFPEKRHVLVKVNRTSLHLPLGVKKVLGIFVGMNFLKANEVFEQKHLLKALQHYLPHAHFIEDSFFVDENHEEKIQTMYLEVGGGFSFEEIKRLRGELPDELKRCVEQLMPPVFMPRNEEEVMRHIVTLSQQLKYVKDIPQMVISFDEQTENDLVFTVILVRILHPDSPSIQTLFQKAATVLTFIPDRIKTMGMLRKKNPKEAIVFKVRVSHVDFLRGDHSVDLYKARQKVVFELQQIIGEIRDFNGGMISKQVELLLSLKKILGPLASQHEFLLENFFHSIFPIECRSVLDPELLKILFHILLEMIGSSKKYLEWKEESGRCFVMIRVQDFSQKQCILERIEKLHLPSFQLVSLHLKIFDTLYLGYICLCEDVLKRKLFLSSLNLSQ